MIGESLAGISVLLHLLGQVNINHYYFCYVTLSRVHQTRVIKESCVGVQGTNITCISLISIIYGVVYTTASYQGKTHCPTSHISKGEHSQCSSQIKKELQGSLCQQKLLLENVLYLVSGQQGSVIRVCPEANNIYREEEGSKRDLAPV